MKPEGTIDEGRTNILGILDTIVLDQTRFVEIERLRLLGSTIDETMGGGGAQE